jgi:hypothetical protein
MLGLANVSSLMLAALLAGGATAVPQEGGATATPETVSAEAPALDAQTPPTSEELELQRWKLRVLQHPYDLATFYRAGGSRGLYEPSGAPSLSSFYRAETSSARPYWHWRLAPVPRFRGYPPPVLLGPALGEMDLDGPRAFPYDEESEDLALEPGFQPSASTAERPHADSKREP